MTKRLRKVERMAIAKVLRKFKPRLRGKCAYVAKKATKFVSLLESLSQPFKALDAEVEKELVKLAMAIATQIIRREIKLDPGKLLPQSGSDKGIATIVTKDQLAFTP